MHLVEEIQESIVTIEKRSDKIPLIYRRSLSILSGLGPSAPDVATTALVSSSPALWFFSRWFSFCLSSSCLFSDFFLSSVSVCMTHPLPSHPPDSIGSCLGSSHRLASEMVLGRYVPRRSLRHRVVEVSSLLSMVLVILQDYEP